MGRTPDGVGLGTQSGHKYKNARGLFRITAETAAGALQKWRQPSVHPWLDLNAGPGQHSLEDGTVVDGTPPIAVRELLRVNIPFHAVFIEEHSASAEALNRLLWETFPKARGRVTVECGDNHILAPLR